MALFRFYNIHLESFLKVFFLEKLFSESIEKLRWNFFFFFSTQNKAIFAENLKRVETIHKGSQRFVKEERLHSKKLIGQLFSEGKSFYKYPFKVVFLEVEKGDTAPVTILISVSKRNFKRAVDRNKIKRLNREAFRKNKSVLYKSGTLKNDKTLLIALIYTAKAILPYREIEKKIILILRQFLNDHEQTSR